MDAQSEIERARMEPNGDTAAEIAVRNAGDDMDELLQTIEAELTAQQNSAAENHQLDNGDFEESIRHALEGLSEEGRAEAAAASAMRATEQTRDDLEETAALGDEPLLSAEELAWTLDEPDWGSEATTSPDVPVAVREHRPEVAAELTTTADEPAPADVRMEAELMTAPAEQIPDDSLEAVELELALQNQNLISLGFEESLHTALNEIGGEMLFQMRLEREDCQRIAAVRIGAGEQQQFALVIMPPGGGLMRVEPVEQSSNPLAIIAKSYAGLVDTFRAAA